jgi:hypothetical protein
LKELLMMGIIMPETCSAAFLRLSNKFTTDCCIWLGVLFKKKKWVCFEPTVWPDTCCSVHKRFECRWDGQNGCRFKCSLTFLQCFFFNSMPLHVLMDFVVFPPGHGNSVTDFWGWDAHEAQLRCPDDVSGDIGGWSARRALKPKFY